MRLKRPTGMSLLELLVVMAIMLALTAALAGGYTKMRGNYKLRAATDLFLSSLYTARNLAINNNTRYAVYIGKYDATDGDLANQYYYTVRRFTNGLPGEIAESVTLDRAVEFGTPVDATFLYDFSTVPLPPFVTFDAEGSASGTVSIALRPSNIDDDMRGKRVSAAESRLVKVLAGGLIRIEDEKMPTVTP